MLGRLVRVALLLGCGAALGACGASVAPPEPTAVAAPIVDCLAVPAERCAAALDQARAEAAPGVIPTRVRMTCSQPSCTLVDGLAQVDVWLSDGTVSSWQSAWTGALAIPPSAMPDDAVILPVTPACVGVDLARCREKAKGIIVPVGQTGRVVSITVTCTVASCGPSEGQGETRVTYEDGTTRVADWAYAGN